MYPPWLVYFIRVLNEATSSQLTAPIIREIKNQTSTDAHTTILTSSISALLGGGGSISTAECLVLLRQSGYCRPGVYTPDLSVEQLNTELLIALGYMMFKKRMFACMEAREGERWWRDYGVGTLLREGRRNNESGTSNIPKPSPGSHESPEVTAEALRSLTHKLRTMSRQINGLKSALDNARPKTGTLLESYCCNIAWTEAVRRIKKELGEEKQRAEERQHIQSISAYFESLLELTKGIERGEEESKSEALMRTLKIEMGRRKDIIEWVEKLGAGTDRDWGALNRAFEGLGVRGIAVKSGEAEISGRRMKTEEITEAKLQMERKKVRLVLDRLEGAIEEFCPYSITRK